MNPTAFETWLGGIAALTEPQRRRAWQALALPEPAGGSDIETRHLFDRGSDRAVDDPNPSARRHPRGRRSRLTRPVSPNLGNAVLIALAAPIATTTTSSVGARRAIYHAIAAKPVGAHSTP
jgi:hypothetical protein